MGLKDYFRPPKPQVQAAAEQPFDIDIADARPPSASPHPAHGSSAASTRSFSAGSTRSLASSVFLDDIRHQVVVNHLYQNQLSKNWIGDGSGDSEGALVRRARGDYLTCPAELIHSPLAAAVATLNVSSAMTINSLTVKSFLTEFPTADKVPVLHGLHVQILPTIQDLPRARKHQYAAFIASEALLIVWDDNPMRVFRRACVVESELLELVLDNGFDKEKQRNDTKNKSTTTVAEIDGESGQVKPETRPILMINTFFVSVVTCIITVMLGASWRQLAMEVTVDGNYFRLFLILLEPSQVFFTLFFAQAIVAGLAQCVGPITQLTQNSKYYSACPPTRTRSKVLPHVTIQCPVYRERLAGVVLPTIRSLKQAISTYELQGGSANIFVNDDGLQLLSEQERQERLDFYADHSIGWVARPRDGEDGFLRRGKFKKASNMNFAMMISCMVEDKLAAINRSSGWSQNEEAEAYEVALKEVLLENGRAWADGNIRIGDYILLVDSDTRVPKDCLLDAVSEMESSPDVGIMQFSSGVMQVVHTYFENGITFFTNLVYSAIRYTVSNGDVAPFVGHNAILRWSAIQQVSYSDEDGYDKFWSESHVSEDFDMSLRLQCAGYTIRLAAWAGEGFKEGVSLTVYDELARWEKYAYGCNELLFHPIRTWLWRGPFTPLFRRFLFSSIPLTSKITIISYIGTYYAIGAGWVITAANYFLVGWYNAYLDKYYLDSWRVWFSIIVIFTALGNVGLAMMRWRSSEGALIRGLVENFKWTALFSIFLGGLSLHVSQAILAHMFEIDMTWGATAKEAEFSNFFIEVPKVASKFKWSMLFGFGFVALIVILATASFVPHDWRITDFVAILPISTIVGGHILLPIALNPAIMIFSW